MKTIIMILLALAIQGCDYTKTETNDSSVNINTSSDDAIQLVSFRCTDNNTVVALLVATQASEDAGYKINGKDVEYHITSGGTMVELTARADSTNTLTTGKSKLGSVECSND
jgi:hypothetical protein